MNVSKLNYGVEIIHGLMGTGKSFFAVRRAIQSVEQHRRPVYTNLPMRWRVVRQYLKNRGGEELANLFRRLDEAHWRSFLERQHKWASFRTQLDKLTPADLPHERFSSYCEANSLDPHQAKKQTKFFPAQINRWFVHENGPNVIDGPNANWIPATSIIIVDEVQHWHPMTKQTNDKNREDLRAYLTMCRHHLHWCWFITQDPANISIEIRRLYHYTWRVWNRGEDLLALKIRLKHLGIKAMGYMCSTPDQEAAAERNPNSPEARPTDSFTLVPWWYTNQIYFRLYDSFTNIGSPRQLQRELKQARSDAGLTDSGDVRQIIDTAETSTPGDSMHTILKRTFRNAAVLTFSVSISYFIGTLRNGSHHEQEPEQIQVQLPPIEWPNWQGPGERPWLNGQRVELGSKFDGGRVQLDYVSTDSRSLVFRADDAWWLWEWGQSGPVYVGQIEDVRSQVQLLTQGDSTSQPIPGS